MKNYTLLFLLFCGGSLYSQTYYLNIWSNGTPTSIAVNDIRKISFLNVSDTIENGDQATIIQVFRLRQNYPNPFNPSTTIEYQIPEKGRVEIKIFSLNGQLLKMFENTHASAGDYKVIWNGMDAGGQTVASGFYIYQVSYSNSIITKKMLFLK